MLPALQSEFNHPKLTVELLLKSSPTQWSSSSDEGSKGLTQPCGSVLARAKSYHCAFMEVKLENSAEELVFSLRGEQNSAKQVTQYSRLSLGFIQLKTSKLQVPLWVVLMCFSLGSKGECKQTSASKRFSA